jgi:hypothetical protein
MSVSLFISRRKQSVKIGTAMYWDERLGRKFTGLLHSWVSETILKKILRVGWEKWYFARPPKSEKRVLHTATHFLLKHTQQVCLELPSETLPADIFGRLESWIHKIWLHDNISNEKISNAKTPNEKISKIEISNEKTPKIDFTEICIVITPGRLGVVSSIFLISRFRCFFEIFTFRDFLFGVFSKFLFSRFFRSAFLRSILLRSR